MSLLLPDERGFLRQHKAELIALLQVGDALGLADEFMEERAAIREFDGGLSRGDAEYLAARDCARGLLTSELCLS